MILALIVTLHLIGLASALHAVMNTRTAQGAIAWALSLATLPYLAVPAYWLFGRSKFGGYIEARREADLQNKQIEKEVLEAARPYLVPEGEEADATRAAECMAGMPALGGHRADLLIDGEATFDDILEGIDQAKEYILFQFYIIRDDGLGKRVKKHLLAKAREGVRVFFLYDEIGCITLPDAYVEELREAGAQVADFDARDARQNRYQLNFRNHRKVVVTDGRVAWIGGHNVGDEYLGKDEKIGRWRDTHVRIEGPAVMKVQFSFVEDWHWASQELIELDWTPHPAADGSDLRALIIPTGPADTLETATLMFVHALNAAEKRIWIASPYFVPDHSVIVALQLAGLRGVDLRILIPDKADYLMIDLAAYAHLEDAMKTGGKIYRYTDGFLHQKAVLIDDDVAAISTANFDNRSFRLNFEITAVVYDAGFAGEVERMFLDDFERSRLIEDDEYSKKPWWFKLGVRLAWLTAPIQ